MQLHIVDLQLVCNESHDLTVGRKKICCGVNKHFFSHGENLLGNAVSMCDV
jgi:hypothetical protein